MRYSQSIDQLLVVILLLLLSLNRGISTDSNCPNVCICIRETLACENGGLYEIPSKMSRKVKKITLISHRFQQNFLVRHNFSQFSKPKYFIQQLSIRQSNIVNIRYQTFYDLNSLDTLDLSQNSRLSVDPRALDNLKLKYLKFDNIGELNLVDDSFKGLMVSVLSLKDSNLKRLPYNVLRPLDKDLRKLYLDNNKLTYLSAKFESLFRKLKTLHLYRNQFLCSCPLVWLSRTLRWRLQYYKAKETLITDFEGPKCHGPLYLKNLIISNVPREDFNCDPPKLEKIEVRFRDLTSVLLRCFGSVKPSRAPIDIYWRYFNSDWHPSFFRQLPSNDSNQASVIVKRRHGYPLDKFECSAQSTSGNSSIRVNINWPPRPLYTFPNTNNNNNNNNNININTQNSNNNNNNNNWRRSDAAFDENIFFKEQFTLLELLGSIIGTFIVTMTIFIVIYKFCFYRSLRIKKEQLKKSGYATYEVGLYSTDSQTYDIPHYTTSSHDYRTKLSGSNNRPPPFYPPMKNNFYIDNGDKYKI